MNELLQVAIVFKTPAYWNVATENPVKVHLELRRKSDQETSEPVEFTFVPQMFGMWLRLRQSSSTVDNKSFNRVRENCLIV